MPDFLLDGVRYHGHDITIAWNRGDVTTSPDTLSGFRVNVDGRLVHYAPTREPVELPRFALK